jgi:uncharacterized repeat protein (TIGR01451 family)
MDADPPVARSGEEVDFTITVRNAGPDAACGAPFRALFPSGLSGLSLRSGPRAGGTLGAAGEIEVGDQEVSGTVDLLPGDKVVFKVKATVDPIETCPVPPRLRLKSTVVVEPPSGVTDPDWGNNTDRATVTRLAGVDLGIKKDDGVDEVKDGAKVTYTIKVQNGGPDAACEARVLDAFPAELDLVTWTCDPSLGARCGAQVHREIRDRVSIPPQGRVLYTARGSVSCVCAPARLENTAEVEPPTGVTDLHLENNESEDVDALVCPCPPNLKLEKRIGGSCAEGQEVLYTLLLMNEGPGTQGDNPGDEITDNLPPDLTLLEASASSGILTVDGNAIAWNGAVGPMAEVTIMLRAEIEAGTLGETVCNQAFLFADSDGDGVNDDEIPSDDPRRPGAEDSTCFEVCPPGVGGIPALSPLALLLLCALLAALGCLGLRSAAP